jgi:hypothetical protein
MRNARSLRASSIHAITNTTGSAIASSGNNTIVNSANATRVIM